MIKKSNGYCTKCNYIYCLDCGKVLSDVKVTNVTKLKKDHKCLEQDI